MTIKKLIKKYPVLEGLVSYVNRVNNLLQHGIIKGVTETRKSEMYEDFKTKISCIGLEPSEYEFCIRWFCDTMAY